MSAIVTANPTAAVSANDRTKARFRRAKTGRRILGIASGAWLVIVLVGVFGARWLAPYSAQETDLLNILKGPSAAHWLGTDSLGRDVLSRLMYGGTPTILGVLTALVLYLVIGVVVGLIAGYAGGLSDRVVMALTSVLIALPGLVVLFVVLSVFRNNTIVAMAVYGVHASPGLILLVRSAALSVRNELFVDAAKVSGLSPFYIVFKHVLPRARGLIIVQIGVFAATSLVVESTLSYLGFGTQPPNPSWGNMVNEAAQKIAITPFMLFPTGGAIALTALAVGLLSDLARDSFAAGWSASKLTRGRAVSAPESAGREPMPEGALLSVESLDVGYHSPDGIVPIVRDVDFTIGRGETLGLVGESGSGKTTVAFGILGVPGDGVAITKGKVLFDGTDLSGLNDKDLTRFRGKRVAYVAQEPMVALDPNYKIGKQLAEAIRANDPSVPASGIQARILELLGQVELPDPVAVTKKFPHELSGGMAQRVSIAFALAGRPELLVADEPTTALDVTVQAGILGLLIRLRAETGMSMLIITHDWGVVADVCDRVVVLYHGEIVEQAPAEQIFATPAHEYTRALLKSNPHGAKPGEDLPVISGTFLTPSEERAAAENRELAETGAAR